MNALPLEKGEDIAVIGFSFKGPGDATSPGAFWKMLLEGRSSMTDVPRDRFNIDKFCGRKEGKSGTFQARGGNFIREDIAGFDAAFFSLNPEEVRAMDPQQRWLLEAAYHSIEAAGLTLEDVRGTNTATYVGSFMRDYETMLSKDPELPARYKVSGTSVAMLANRLSWFFDLSGPSVALDTACSSSLSALHLACHSIRSGESGIALAAGCNLIFGPESSMGLSDMHFLSPDSKCYSFDSRANGYARGEGIGCVVLKSLKKALDDKNTIRAVIRACEQNQDGKTVGITQPSSLAQENLIRQSYQRAGLDMSVTRYFEAHGTGTMLGDPIEAKAISNAFKGTRAQNDPLYIGAVKSNIGHLEGASGIVGLIKSILVLESGIIPPNINFENVNPKILVDQWNIKFPLSPTPWPKEGLRRASLNSFGFGGSNVHVVLDDAYHYLQERNLTGLHHTRRTPTLPGSSSLSNGSSTTRVKANRQKLLVWSSADEQGVSRLVNDFDSYIRNKTPEDLDAEASDIAYTLSEKRTRLPVKSYFVTDEEEALWSGISTSNPRATRSLKSPKVGFIFTGQGAQWYAMGRELMVYSPFRQSIQDADLYFRQLGCSWSVIDELIQRDKTSSKLDLPEYSQPLSTVLQVALVNLLTDWGITPSVVVGHSSGEIAAAFCMGAISKEAAWRIAYFRGFAIASAIRTNMVQGAMLSVGLSSSEVEKHIDQSSNITVGCINSPQSVTLSGPSAAISTLQGEFERKGIFCRKLRVDVAYHHPKYMETAASFYEPLIGHLPARGTKCCAMVSSVTGQVVEPHTLVQTDYWVQNLVSTVRFSEALSLICTQHGKKQLGQSRTRPAAVNYLLEVGPHSTLQGPVRDILTSVRKHQVIEYGALLIRNKSARSSSLEAAGKLYCHGFPVNIVKVNELDEHSAKKCRMMADLPSYAFNHTQKYWLESRASKNFRFGSTPYHELLGSKVVDWNPLEARWQHRIILSDKSWIKAHVINGVVLYPAAGLLVMAIEAARQSASLDKKIAAYRLKDVSVYKGLVIPQDAEGIEVQLYFRPSQDGDTANNEQAWNEFRICFYEDEQWVESCRGAISVEYQNDSLFEVGPQRILEETERYSSEYAEGSKLCVDVMSSKKLYQSFKQFGYDYGPTFRLIQNPGFNETGHATGDVNLIGWKSTTSESVIEPHLIHPAALDCIVQLIFPAMSNGFKEKIPTMVPTLVKSLWISGLEASDDTNVKVHMHGKPRGHRGATGTFRGVNASTRRACIAGEIEATFISSNVDSAGADEAGSYKFFNMDWKPDTALLEPGTLSALFTDAADTPTPEDQLMFEEKELLCLFSISRTIESLEKNDHSHLPAHLLRYIQWMKHHQSARSQDIIKADSEAFDKLLTKVESCDAEGYLLGKVVRNLESVLKGEVDALEILMTDKELLEAYYLNLHDSRVIFQKLTRYLDALAHKNPALKVLEIGGGTGGATTYVLDTLMHHGEHELGAHRFSDYVFTDISPSFFEHAKEKFNNERMSFKTLDIENISDCKEEGMYDLVVAANVLHATADIESTLRNTRKLLKTGGKLAMIEVTDPQMLRVAFAFGLLPGWWQSIEEYRPLGPIMEPNKWNENLLKTQFSGVDVLFTARKTTDIHEMSCPPAAAMVSTAVRTHADKNGSTGNEDRRIVIISNDTELEQKVSAKLFARLTEVGNQCVQCSVDKVSSYDLRDASCIFLPDINSPWLQNMDNSKYKLLKRLVSEPVGLLWVFSQDTCSVKGPDRQLVLGFSRSIGNERDTFKFVTLELEETSSISAIVRYVEKVVQASLVDSESTQETEYVVKDNVIHIGRVVEANYLQKPALRNTNHGSELQPLQQKKRPLVMTIGSVGLLDTLQFVDDEKHLFALEANELEIAIKAVGINFKDILIALGQIPETTLGSECAGYITRVGDAVKNKFAVGDRVACAMKGAYRTYGRCWASSATKIPSDMDFTTGAAMVIAFATAYYCLIEVARVRKGESILIHAGAGSFGQAAIQLATLYETEIFVTVSTEAKKQLLKDLYGIPDTNFFSSRTLAFKDSIMRMTKGRGVDIVINSLSGEALRCSWECIAPLGRFVEVGKRDISASSVSALGNLPMSSFAKSTTFASVDFATILSMRPAMAEDIITAIMTLAQSGKIFAPKPITVFKASQIEEAFRIMQSGKHTGKFVIEFSDEDMVMVNPPVRQAEIFDPQATYVISGGLGGVGQSIVKWMVGRNARNFILLSRKKVYSRQILQFLDTLKAKGVNASTPPCDITDEQSLRLVLAECRARMPPVRGCIQASMVLKSAMFSNMTLNDFYASVKPKVDGSWNLHKLLPAQMDFFIMLSSYAGIIGLLAQSNYAAGNTYQDGLARYRVSRGEKAISLDLGIIESVGFVAANEEIGDFLIAGGHHALREVELHNILSYYCDPRLEVQSEMKCQIIMGLPLPSQLKAENLVEPSWLSKPFFRQLHQISVGSASKSKDLQVLTNLESLFSNATSLSEVGNIISEALRSKLASLLMIEKEAIDSDRPIHTFGVDSLVAVEVRNWFKKVVDADIAVFIILGTASISAVGLLAASKSKFLPAALRKESLGI